MLQRPLEIALLREILMESCVSDAAAKQHLVEARRLGVDPLDYCAHRFGLGNVLTWRRAALWAGYRFIESVPLPAEARASASAHLDRLGEMRTLRLGTAGREVAFGAPRFEQMLNLARSRQTSPDLTKRLCIVPPDAIEAALAHHFATSLMDEARQKLTRIWSGMTAATALPKPIRWSFALLLALLVVLVMTAGAVNRPLLMPVVALLLIGPGLLRLAATLPGPPRLAPRLLGDGELPVYSVLIPLRDEARMVPMLRRAMTALDYPPEKLDIKFVVEAGSPETIAAVETILGDPRFRLVVVPDAMPRTKPKAINYALPLARGAHVVVYDAEDVPEPRQLRLAASLFAADPALACLQAELVPENADENALTALFAGEYAGLFGRLLPALARWNLPVPLGGTSNHFRIEILRDIGGWDAANVTEDADLGVRLRRRGLRAEPFASRTYEEAPTSLRAWMAQRTRWMKGWMQTYLVHSLTPLKFLREVGWKAFFGFHILVGGMILTALLHTVFIGSLAARLIVEGPGGFLPVDIWDAVSIVVLLVGYGGAIAIVFSGLAHLRAWHLLGVQVLLPAYWLLHSIATFLAAWQLVTRPSYWAKTTHGVTRQERGTPAPPRPVETVPLRSRSG